MLILHTFLTNPTRNYDKSKKKKSRIHCLVLLITDINALGITVETAGWVL